MRIVIAIITIVLVACEGRPKTTDELGAVLDQLPKIEPGYTLNTIDDDPVSVLEARSTVLKDDFADYETLVGYFFFDEVIVFISAYPGDDMYVGATTFVNSKKIDSSTLSLGYGGFIGCGYNSIDETLKFIAPNMISIVEHTSIAKCNENDDEIPGTEVTTTLVRQFEFLSDGKIAVTESSTVK